MVVHCLFEQSGTFKNEFKKLSYEAYDYDILNDYGQTDFQIDLFNEISDGYEGKLSIFDTIKTDDLVIEFFPCTRFEDQILLSFRGERYQMKKWTQEEKLKESMRLHDELNENYKMISQMVIIALRKMFRLVIENPYAEQHYLKRYWCIKPTIIDMDRTDNGDYYKKPTQYYFIGFEPKNNFLFESLQYVERKKQKKGFLSARERSEIHPQYANRFIRQYLIDESEVGQ